MSIRQRSRALAPSRVLALGLVATLTVIASCSGGDDATPSTTAPATTTTIVLTSDGLLRVRPVLSLLLIDNGMGLSAFGDDDPANTIVSPNVDSTIAYDLGPAVADESDIVAAEPVSAGGQWQVSITLSDEATTAVRAMAEKCADKAEVCEAGRLAVTVDGFTMLEIAGENNQIGPVLVIGSGLNELQATTISDAIV